MWERLRAELEAERIVNENNNRTFQTKSECDAARRAILSPYSCLKFDCHCMGHDAEGGGSSATTMDPTTNPYFAGPQQGVAFSPANEADQIKQWVKDYHKQNDYSFDEDFFDELYANNEYFRKEIEKEYAQAHAIMMEMNDRESDFQMDDLLEDKKIKKINYVDKVKLYQKQLSDATISKHGRTIVGEHGTWDDAVNATKDVIDGVIDIVLNAGDVFSPMGSLTGTTISTVLLEKSLAQELKELFDDIQWATLFSRDISELNKKIDEIYAKHMAIMLSQLPGGTVLRYLWNHPEKYNDSTQ